MDELIDARACPIVWIDTDLFDSGVLATIGPSAFSVYCVLARHANRQGTCFPSLNRITRMAGLSRQTVVDAISTLEKHQLVHKEKRDKGRSNLYTLRSHTPPSTPPDSNDSPPSTSTVAGTSAPRKSAGKSSGGKNTPSSVFKEAWDAYPKRPGRSRKAAWKAWQARLNEGVEEAAMLKGTKEYAAYCTAMGTEPQYIKQPQTFYGPDHWFDSEYEVPDSADPKNQGKSGAQKKNLMAYYENEDLV